MSRVSLIRHLLRSSSANLASDSNPPSTEAYQDPAKQRKKMPS